VLCHNLGMLVSLIQFGCNMILSCAWKHMDAQNSAIMKQLMDTEVAASATLNTISKLRRGKAR
jgi:hypothetical protein